MATRSTHLLRTNAVLKKDKMGSSIWVLHEIDGNQLMYTPFLHSVTHESASKDLCIVAICNERCIL